MKIRREMGEISLIKVARTAEVEGLWVYVNGAYRDIAKERSATCAWADMEALHKCRPPFVIYHIHPPQPKGEWGNIAGFSVFPPSVQDVEAYIKVSKWAGDAPARVADPSGLWTYRVVKQKRWEEGQGEYRAVLRRFSKWLTEDAGKSEQVDPQGLRALNDAVKKMGLSIHYTTFMEMTQRVMEIRLKP